MSIVRRIIEKNWYINHMVKSGASSSYNRALKKFVSRIEAVDSIADFENFKEALKEMPQNKHIGIAALKTAYGESLLYGHVQAIMKYANASDKELFYFPVMEHGIDFAEQINPIAGGRIFQGEYKKQRLKQEYPNTPVYTVGPYILYADSYYSLTQMKRMKEKVGKLLLVFPAHTIENVTLSYDGQDFFNDVFQLYGKGFDSVWVCTYWADAQHPVLREYAANGARIVSAGFRSDPNFIRRLRTIIELSDAVVGNEIGSFIGHSYALKKRVILREGNIKTDGKASSHLRTPAFLENHRRFMSEFDISREPFCQEQRELIEYFWGLSQFKTPEQILGILKENKHRVKSQLGFV